jgi:hypothetical protein
MGTQGKLTVIVSDFKDAFNNYGQKDQAKNLQLILDKPEKFNQDKFFKLINNLGYDPNLPTTERLALAYEIVDSKLPAAIDAFEFARNEVKKNIKFKFDESIFYRYFEVFVTLGIALVFLVIVTIAVVVENGTDSNGEVYTLHSSTTADVDTSSKGTLSLKSERGSFLETDYKSIKLYIATDTPTNGKLKVYYTGASLKPFEIIEFKTKNDNGTPSIIIDLPLNTKNVQWIE